MPVMISEHHPFPPSRVAAVLHYIEFSIIVLTLQRYMKPFWQKKILRNNQSFQMYNKLTCDMNK